MFELKTRTEIWIHNIEALVKNSKPLPNELYLSLKFYLINQVSYEHCKLISQNNFFHKLKPCLRHELICELFGPFIK